MALHRVAPTALAFLALAAGGGRLGAEGKKSEPVERHDRLEALAERLGLSAEQKEKVKKIHADFDRKEDPLEQQLWNLHHEEREAVNMVLTGEQRIKAHAAVRAEVEKEFDQVAARLGLGAGQKRRVRKIHAEYEPRFHELAREEGEKAWGRFRELRHQEFAAIRKELTEGQRAGLPGVLREELHQWRDPAARREHLKAVADKVGLSPQQKEHLAKIHEEFDKKARQPSDRLRQLHKQEREAVAKVLTEAQRTKLRELLKGGGKKNGHR